MTRHRNPGGIFWLVDLAGATLFAFGIADAVAMLASGGGVADAALAAIVGGGLLRAVGVALVHRFSIAPAQQVAGDARRMTERRLVATPILAPPSIGAAAALAFDHSRAIEAYQARFVPVRFAAALSPLIVAAIVAVASWVAAAIMIATLVPFVIGMILAGTLARHASERQLAAMGDLSGLFVDRIRHLPIIRHFRAEERIARQVDGAARALAERTVAVLRAAFLSSAVLEFFAALSVALVAVYCGFDLLGLLPFPAPDHLTLREAFFALAMAPEFYLPMRRLAAAYHEKQLGEAATSALAALPAPLPPRATAPFTGLSVEDARIEWPDRSIGPVSFTLGTTGLVALTGPTGSGKTSLLAAIAGQIALTDGMITPIDAADIAWAAQRPLILPGTLADNLALGRPDATREEMDAVIAEVGLAKMLATRHSDARLTLDHRGSGLSGGERRRLGLARAILSGRPLLLADEPTADLDADSAREIVVLITRLARKRAVLVATHDPLLVAACDRNIAL